jgi:hypothetical protein
MAGRSLGLSPPAPAKAPVKGREEPGKEGRKQRRRRKASVRALQVARGLHRDETPENAVVELSPVE